MPQKQQVLASFAVGHPFLLSTGTFFCSLAVVAQIITENHQVQTELPRTLSNRQAHIPMPHRTNSP
jgi:hypothetical protein